MLRYLKLSFLQVIPSNLYNDLFLQLLSQFLFYVRYNSKVARIATSELLVDQRLHYIFIMAPFSSQRAGLLWRFNNDSQETLLL